MCIRDSSYTIPENMSDSTIKKLCIYIKWSIILDFCCSIDLIIECEQWLEDVQWTNTSLRGQQNFH